MGTNGLFIIVSTRWRCTVISCIIINFFLIILCIYVYCSCPIWCLVTLTFFFHEQSIYYGIVKQIVNFFLRLFKIRTEKKVLSPPILKSNKDFNLRTVTVETHWGKIIQLNSIIVFTRLFRSQGKTRLFALRENYFSKKNFFNIEILTLRFRSCTKSILLTQISSVES